MKTFETIDGVVINLGNIAYVKIGFVPYPITHKMTYRVKFVGGGYLDLDREDGKRLLEEMEKEEKR